MYQITGALDEEARFELQEGWIVYKVTKNPIHDMTVAWITL
jgi:hypothetical protein